MSDVPETPKDFFGTYVPARFAEMKSALAAQTSVGSLLFRVTGVGEWSFRLKDGEMVTGDSMEDDVLMQLTCSAEDFEPIVVEAAKRQGSKEPTEQQQMAALKAITINEEKAALLKNVQGTIAVVVNDAGTTRKLCLTPGKAEVKVDAPDCSLECDMNDFISMQTGEQQPMQLVMGGKMKIVGNAQLPMALMGVLA